MAEAAGLVLGVLGVAGLFTACIDNFDIIVRGKDFSEDFDILCTQLVTQRIRFVLWGESIGLVPNPNGKKLPYNKAIDRPDIRPSLESTLNNIRLLLQKADIVVARYEDGSESFPGRALSSSTGMDVFKEHWDSFKARLRKNQKQKSMSKVTRWAIHDSTKFQAHVTRIRELVDALESITTSLGLLERQHARLIEEIETISDTQSLSLLRSASSRNAASLSIQDVSDTASRRLDALAGSLTGGKTTTTNRTGASSSFYTARSQPSVRSIISSQSTNQKEAAALDPILVRTGSLQTSEVSVTADRSTPNIDNPFMENTDLPQGLPQNQRLLADILKKAEKVKPLSFASGDSRYGDQLSEFKRADELFCLQNSARMISYAYTGTSAARRMFIELRQIREAGVPFVTAAPVGDDLSKILASIEGPPDTPYEGGIFFITVSISEENPSLPPLLRFHTRVYHPNIDSRGNICADYHERWSALPKSKYTKGAYKNPDSQWFQEKTTGIWSLGALLTALCALLASPDVDDPLVPEIAQKYVENYDEYCVAARLYTKRYATKIKPDESYLVFSHELEQFESELPPQEETAACINSIQEQLRQDEYEDEATCLSTSGSLEMEGLESWLKKFREQQLAKKAKTKQKQPKIAKYDTSRYKRMDTNNREEPPYYSAGDRSWRKSVYTPLFPREQSFVNYSTRKTYDSYHVTTYDPYNPYTNTIYEHGKSANRYRSGRRSNDYPDVPYTNEIKNEYAFNNGYYTNVFPSQRLYYYHSPLDGSSVSPYSTEPSYYRSSSRSTSARSGTTTTDSSTDQRPGNWCTTRKATEEDARRHNIPAGYSLKYWDPSEEPIIVFASVFDANSVGKWIYDWTVHHHGPSSPISDMAGELWLLFIQLYGKLKRAEEAIPQVRETGNKEMLEDFIESGERLTTKLQKLLKASEESVMIVLKNHKHRQKRNTMLAKHSYKMPSTLGKVHKQISNILDELGKDTAAKWPDFDGFPAKFTRKGSKLINEVVLGKVPAKVAARPEQANPRYGTEFVDSIFGRERQLEQTERFMASIRLWNLRFDANCEEIFRKLEKPREPVQVKTQQHNRQDTLSRREYQRIVSHYSNQIVSSNSRRLGVNGTRPSSFSRVLNDTPPRTNGVPNNTKTSEESSRSVARDEEAQVLNFSFTKKDSKSCTVESLPLPHANENRVGVEKEVPQYERENTTWGASSTNQKEQSDLQKESGDNKVILDVVAANNTSKAENSLSSESEYPKDSKVKIAQDILPGDLDDWSTWGTNSEQNKPKKKKKKKKATPVKDLDDGKELPVEGHGKGVWDISSSSSSKEWYKGWGISWKFEEGNLKSESGSKDMEQPASTGANIDIKKDLDDWDIFSTTKMGKNKEMAKYWTPTAPASNTTKGNPTSSDPIDKIQTTATMADDHGLSNFPSGTISKKVSSPPQSEAEESISLSEMLKSTGYCDIKANYTDSRDKVTAKFDECQNAKSPNPWLAELRINSDSQTISDSDGKSTFANSQSWLSRRLRKKRASPQLMRLAAREKVSSLEIINEALEHDNT